MSEVINRKEQKVFERERKEKIVWRDDGERRAARERDKDEKRSIKQSMRLMSVRAQ